jgi:SagB-type dehydrogenase family enzyme
MTRTLLATEADPRGPGIEKVIASRRSQRDFSGAPMALAELSRLLQYACGVTDTRNGFRAAPSAGATYPIEVYPVVNSVDGLSRGGYRYLVAAHELETVRPGDLRRELVRAGLGQSFLATANVVLVLSSVYRRTTQRYGKRGYRYIHFEAGHVAQNACLVAASLGLGSCPIGAFDDGDLNRMLGLDGSNESALYLVAIGRI